MTRLALGLEYEGTAFMGWQRQSHAGRTVQACVEEAITKVADHAVQVTCAGRTDAGVHATGQVVHFDTHATRSLRGWLLGLNSNLPADVAANWIMEVPDDFHARYHARARQYRYTVLNRLTRSAVTRAHITWIHRPLDEQRMQAATHYLTGEHDFSAFRAVDCQAHSPVRTIHNLNIHRESEFILIDVVANGFLHHMVRNIAGVLIAIGEGKQEPDWARQVLEGRKRALAGITSPPQGLCFKAVLYPPAYDIPVPEGALFNRLSANL
ncbi:MAG: tRNA pseudouridine(38-40) synthase TruA [Gammaproteobacteria bacterium]